ncbi:hypothetical protein [Aurantimonas endophytica]|uniref:Uncharacterized protein n=1 Tax=Aurantimonas endophytica TaxID=1522175 RepID=A0A7W6MPN8_9HYPH|nr:hypothetical protein [Aurantimonas endophytica]MBB4003109.1 hypothetical protein [Aurantimonas endophytica]MCO6403981.1 hypothetical protein [Aurantimonas endophytica]
MSDDPLFRQILDSRLYALDASGGAPGWIGFVWTQSKPPKTLSVADSFMSGHYLFATGAPTLADNKQAETYAQAVIDWLNQNFGSYSGVFLGCAAVWLASPAGPVFGLPAASAVTFLDGGGGSISTGEDFNLPVGQLTLSVPNQTVVTIGARGLVFGTAGSGKVVFNTQDDTQPPSVSGGAGLPFLGPHGGSFTMAGALSRAGPHNTIDGLSTGMRFLHGTTKGDRCGVFPLIVSGAKLSDLSYAAAVDPLDLFNRVAPLSVPTEGRLRTLFALAGSGSTQIASWYRTPTGQAVDLVPLNGIDGNGEPLPWCGALVLQPTTPKNAATKWVSLTPAGDFGLLAPTDPQAGTTLTLLAGLFGTERIALAPFQSQGSYDRLRFLPDQPAYAPVFPFPQASLSAPPSDKPVLDDTYATAWAAVLNGSSGDASYLAQPSGSPLYAPPQNAANDATPLLPPLATPSPIAQAGSDGGLLLVPLPPYAGLGTLAADSPIEDYGGFESQILSSTRKRILGAASTARLTALRNARLSRLATPTAATVHQATTPQGLYAEVEIPDGGGEALYETVVLARSQDAAGGTLDFGFESLAPELQSLFQTNQLMAVIVNPAKLGAPNPPPANPPAAQLGTALFDREVVIGGWRITAAVGESLNATAYSNILIMKYCDGSLLERVQNPGKWVGTETFSVTGQGVEPGIALTGLSSYLQDYLEAGIAAAKSGNTLYDDFARIVTDANWQGFIVLAAEVDPSGFPDQIKGLVAGIDFTLFRAHHFGATASRVTVSGTSVTMEAPSSLFGLIDYQLPAYRANVEAGGNPDMPLALRTDGDFGFQVLQLQALFRNAALVDFRSRVQLTLDALFLSPVTTAYGSVGKLPASAVVLKGSYQRQGATSVYVFEQNATTRLMLDSNVLPSVAIQRVVFNTLSNSGDGTVRSRFLMSGALEFAILAAKAGDATEDCDLLSFGLPAEAPRTAPATGLSFSGLELTMASPLDAPNAVTFSFEAGKLALDQGSSEPRAHSLFSDLALQVDEFIAGPEDKRAVDFGFLPVSVEPKIKALSGPWYGIAYKVTMGSPGGLVAQAGFASRILIAWAPSSGAQDATAAVFVGLSLPGAAPGAKLMSIQGVMKLTIDSLVLRREAVTTAGLSFTLRLNNVGLTFLGFAKLPPGATINFFLFGDPSGNGSLGWYAAYVADQKTTRIEERAPRQGAPRLLASPGETIAGPVRTAGAIEEVATREPGA